MRSDKRTRFMVIAALVLIAMFSRIIPHAPNFTATAAAGLFAGYYLKSIKESLSVVIISMFLSDCLIGFHSLMLIVYLAMAIPVSIGWRLHQTEKKLVILQGSVLSSSSFFVITNFAVWSYSAAYPKSLAGLEICYIAALPFFQNELAGDLLFASGIFGIFHLAVKLFKLPHLKADLQNNPS